MRLVKHLLLFIGYGTVCALIGVVSLYIHLLQARPDLEPWHRAALAQEFRADRANEVPDFEAYIRLEERLFRALDREVYARVGTGPGKRFNRYSHGSASDPESYPHNWNRTFEMKVSEPRGGALLLHGLSDSPYSMRRLADILHQRGFWVVGLRLPGHGTAPSALAHASWQDFAAAVRIGVRRVRRQIGADKPLYIAGYSNGAALAVAYSLAAQENRDLPMPEGLVLISPAIGVSPVAALARWQARLATFGVLEKLAWNSIYPEYDPYKYNSFPVNAGDQVYQLTKIISERIQHLQTEGRLDRFPRVLAFQSVADATVSPSALVDNLFRRLPPKGHELVLFDINRHAEADALLRSDQPAFAQRLLHDPSLPFAVTLIGNADAASATVSAFHHAPHLTHIAEEPLAMAWPPGVYSLSHIALPFPPTDPIYGNRKPAGYAARQPTVHLGRVELRGESGLLAFPPELLMRLHYNPFFGYMERRVVEFVAAS